MYSAQSVRLNHESECANNTRNIYCSIVGTWLDDWGLGKKYDFSWRLKEGREGEDLILIGLEFLYIGVLLHDL